MCVMQAAERSEKLESEATAMEGQYASAYAGARQTYSQGRARLDAIQAVSCLSSCHLSIKSFDKNHKIFR